MELFKDIMGGFMVKVPSKIKHKPPHRYEIYMEKYGSFDTHQPLHIKHIIDTGYLIQIYVDRIYSKSVEKFGEDTLSA